MTLQRSFCAGLVLCIGAGTAAAERNEGFYLEGQYAPRTSFDLGPRPPTVGTVTVHDDDTDSGFLISGGYGFNQYFSVGLGWTDLGNASRTLRDSATNTTTTFTASVDVISAFGQGFLPIGDDFYLMGKLGYADGDIDARASGATVVPFNASSSDSGALFGVGAGYYFSDNFAVTGEWSRYNLADDIDYVGIGAKFSF